MIEIKLGYDTVASMSVATTKPAEEDLEVSQSMERTLNEMRKFQQGMLKAGLGDRYETAHARLIEHRDMADYVLIGGIGYCNRCGAVAVNPAAVDITEGFE